jgi:DNA-directed RNA polymerase specialized sigma24 family protein
MAVQERTGDDGELKFIPVWGGTYEAWARRYVQQNLWRINKLHTREDALQECAVIFLRCARLYQETDKMNPRWFGSLFRIAVVNDFNTFARRNRRMTEAEAQAAQDYASHHHIELSDGPLLALINKGSEELKTVLRVINDAPSELLNIMLDVAAELRESAEPLPQEAAFSRSLCRLARVKNVRSDLLSELRLLLTKGISTV